MRTTVSNLKIGEKGVIKQVCMNNIPLKLLEMGCIPNKEVELIQIAPLNDPLYIKVNGSHIAIRREVADLIEIEPNNKANILCETIKS